MIEEKIKELGLELPGTPKPAAAYIPAIEVNKIIYTAGQVPSVNGELKYKGKVGSEITLEDGQKAAEICALNCLAAVKSVVGNLDHIRKIVKLTVFVNSADDFTEQHKVGNGASELLAKIFGDSGKHSRSAVGACGLPLNAAVEVEMIAEII